MVFYVCRSFETSMDGSSGACFLQTRVLLDPDLLDSVLGHDCICLGGPTVAILPAVIIVSDIVCVVDKWRVTATREIKGESGFKYLCFRARSVMTFGPIGKAAIHELREMGKADCGRKTTAIIANPDNCVEHLKNLAKRGVCLSEHGRNYYCGVREVLGWECPCNPTMAGMTTEHMRYVMRELSVLAKCPSFPKATQAHNEAVLTRLL